ncbi:DUF1801 domain-containing protein [Aequorivita capsosiphonis]|uniref:DUF1801 domain-containing protein n=1 Tax=Aequorivita capsosiphonis TaxID=487317 RepID=UPI000479D58B|nr:DUF1801 domain-containing protein [Aequorivita capsosiphonis]
MQTEETTADQYITTLSEDRNKVMQKLSETIKKNLPKGFEETMQYGMISYVVPHSIYPDGYHCKPTNSLPFMSISSMKNHIGFHHMGIYSDPDLLKWFTDEYPKHTTGKLDIGKSCIRFKNPNNIQFELLGTLTAKMSVEDWIAKYERTFKK